MGGRDGKGWKWGGKPRWGCEAWERVEEKGKGGRGMGLAFSVSLVWFGVGFGLVWLRCLNTTFLFLGVFLLFYSVAWGWRLDLAFCFPSSGLMGGARHKADIS